MADVQWYPEGGFYETQAGQGEDEWADNAEFDTIEAPAVDAYNSNPQGASVSWSSLTAEASYQAEPYSTQAKRGAPIKPNSY